MQGDLRELTCAQETLSEELCMRGPVPTGFVEETL